MDRRKKGGEKGRGGEGRGEGRGEGGREGWREGGEGSELGREGERDSRFHNDIQIRKILEEVRATCIILDSQVNRSNSF